MEAPDKIYLKFDESEKDELTIGFSFERQLDDDIEFLSIEYVDAALDLTISTSIEFFEWLLEKKEWQFDAKKKVWMRDGHKNRTTFELLDNYINIMSAITEN
jgi:hypothetical protein